MGLHCASSFWQLRSKHFPTATVSAAKLGVEVPNTPRTATEARDARSLLLRALKCVLSGDDATCIIKSVAIRFWNFIGYVYSTSM
jgi:hypothetical protein